MSAGHNGDVCVPPGRRQRRQCWRTGKCRRWSNYERPNGSRASTTPATRRRATLGFDAFVRRSPIQLVSASSARDTTASITAARLHCRWRCLRPPRKATKTGNAGELASVEGEATTKVQTEVVQVQPQPDEGGRRRDPMPLCDGAASIDGRM